MTPAFPPHSSREPDMSVRAVEEAPRKKNRILSELDRRALPSITMKALDGLTCRSLINAYVEKSIIQESSKMAAGPFVNLLLKEQPVMTPKENNAHAVAGLDQPKVKEFVCGFLLFESQIDTLLGHQLGGNPLFLRLFLRCLHFLCLRGYSLWRVFEEWIAATSVQDLISRILRTCESGFSKTRIEAQRDCDLSLAAGGLPEIKRIYPWHPAFKGEDLKTFSEVIPLNPYAKQFGHGDANDDKDLSIASGQENQSVDKPAFGDDLGRKETTALSNQVIQNLGDQQWVIVEKQVQRQLQRALIDSRRVVEDVMAANDMGRSQASFVNEVLAKMKRNQADDNNSVASVPVVYSRALNNNRASIVSSPCASVENESTSPSRKEASYLAASDDDESWEDKSLNLPKISNDSNEGKAPFNKEFSEPPTPLKSTNQVK